MASTIPRSVGGTFKVFMILKVMSLITLLALQSARGQGLLGLSSGSLLHLMRHPQQPAVETGRRELSGGSAATSRHLTAAEDTLSTSASSPMFPVWVAVPIVVGFALLAAFAGYVWAERSRVFAARMPLLQNQKQQRQQEQGQGAAQALGCQQQCQLPARTYVAVPSHQRASVSTATPPQAGPMHCRQAYAAACCPQPEGACGTPFANPLLRIDDDDEGEEDKKQAVSALNASSRHVGINMGGATEAGAGRVAATTAPAGLKRGAAAERDPAAIRDWLRTRLAKQHQEQEQQKQRWRGPRPAVEVPRPVSCGHDRCCAGTSSGLDIETGPHGDVARGSGCSRPRNGCHCRASQDSSSSGSYISSEDEALIAEGVAAFVTVQGKI